MLKQEIYRAVPQWADIETLEEMLTALRGVAAYLEADVIVATPETDKIAAAKIRALLAEISRRS